MTTQHLPADDDLSLQRAERKLFDELVRVVGQVSRNREEVHLEEILIADDTVLRRETVNYSDAVHEHLLVAGSGDADGQDALKELASYALPVLTRMPARSIEDREKRRAAAASMIFTSTLARTRTRFVVSSENESAVTFRLHHQLIEQLQQGCEELVHKLSGEIVLQDGAQFLFTFDGRVEIYEVGQEDSTIRGDIVGTGPARRWRYAFGRDKVSYGVVAVLLVLFLGLFFYGLTIHVQNPATTTVIRGAAGRQFLIQDDGFWRGQIQRLQSGVVPVLLVTVVTLVIRFPHKLVIDWSQRYSAGR